MLKSRQITICRRSTAHIHVAMYIYGSYVTAGFLSAVPLAHVFIGVNVVLQTLQVAQAFQCPNIHLHRDVQKPGGLA